MTLLDAAVVIIALIFVIRGVWIGFIRQTASIAALFLGFIAAGQYHEQFSIHLKPHISTPQVAFLATYVLLFLFVFVAVHLLGWLFSKVVTLSLLGWFDKLLGALFGAVKAVLVNTVLFMVLSGILSSTSPMMQKSILAPALSKSAHVLLMFVRDPDLRRYFTFKEPAISPLLSFPVETSKSLGRDAKKKP